MTSFKEMIAKVSDSNTSLAEKTKCCLESKELRLLPYSQLLGWLLVYSLKHCFLMVGVVLLWVVSLSKDEAGLKEWLRSKLKALASLLGKLGIKAAEALPGIIGGIISWILNRAKDVVGWVSQHLWALVVGVGGLIYTYMVTKR